MAAGGPEELELVAASGWRRWPPQLPGQPIFYLVLTEEYATRIARDWNVPHSGAGFVTRFRVQRAFLDSYEVRRVGGLGVDEYWIPAGDLGALNNAIVGPRRSHRTSNYPAASGPHHGDTAATRPKLLRCDSG